MAETRKKGTLYLIPNTLSDARDDALFYASLPAAAGETAAALDYYVAENARTARAYLKALSNLHPLKKPIQQIRIDELSVKTDARDVPRLLEPILAGQDGGLLSEAGVPAVADPGAILVRLAHEKGIPVRPLVGPSSLLLALMASGMNGQNFAFNGYLPVAPDERAREIRRLEERSKKENQTQIFIETPYRNEALLGALSSALRGDTLLSAATDLTLPTESVITLPVSAWRKRLSKGQMPDFRRKPTVFLFLAS